VSRDSPTLDEQYGPGAEQADAEAEDDVATELQEAIDSPSEYNHRYWTELAGRAVEKLQRQDARIAALERGLAESRDYRKHVQSHCEHDWAETLHGPDTVGEHCDICGVDRDYDYGDEP
jgi:predicted transcriptional regulator